MFTMYFKTKRMKEENCHSVEGDAKALKFIYDLIILDSDVQFRFNGDAPTWWNRVPAVLKF